MLIRVEVTGDPGHCDDEGEDGEADYEKDFVGHDVEQICSCTLATLYLYFKRQGGNGKVSYGRRRSRSLGICPAKTKTWGRDHHARDFRQGCVSV